MREILFRGKPKNKSDYYFFSQNWKEHCKDGFVYGSLVIAHGRYYICVSALCRVNCCVNNSTASMIEVIPETVGQYTGLNDSTKWEQLTKEEQSEWLKNHTVDEWSGKKIFEGDIVNTYNSTKTLKELEKISYKGISFIGIIKWNLTEARFYLEYLDGIKWHLKNDRFYEVIGNTTDNPELLKEMR